jgi:hypothetical protein
MPHFISLIVIHQNYQGPTFVNDCKWCCTNNSAIYTFLMAKETTLNELGDMIQYLVSYMTTNMATKDQLFVLQGQVNSIEGQIREMNHGKLEVRVGDLEEKVFSEIRS